MYTAVIRRNNTYYSKSSWYVPSSRLFFSISSLLRYHGYVRHFTLLQYITVISHRHGIYALFRLFAVYIRHPEQLRYVYVPPGGTVYTVYTVITSHSSVRKYAYLSPRFCRWHYINVWYNKYGYIWVFSIDIVRLIYIQNMDAVRL